MFHRFPSFLRDLWLPALVALGGIAVALVAWSLLVAQQRAHAMGQLRSVADKDRIAIRAAVDTQVKALGNLERFWARFGPQPLPEWRFDADMIVEHFPGIRWIAWLDPSGGGYRLTAPSPTSDPEPERLERARHAAAPTFRGPVGDDGYEVVLPVGNGEQGVLLAVGSLSRLIDPVLRDGAAGQVVEVYWNGRHVYHSGDADADAPAWWRSEGPVVLPLGASAWTVVHRPSGEQVAAMLTPLPHAMLAGGVLLSVLLAALVHQVRLNQRTIRFLGASNRALDVRVREATEKDAALRELNQELELRVERRTAELADAVEELEAFNYSVSHDLRSPIGAILNFGALLEEDYGHRLDDAGREMLARVSASADSALELLEGLLQLSRATRAHLEPVEIDVAALARAVFAEVVAADGAEDAELSVGWLPTAFADRALLTNVLSNLFGNALKYSRGRDKQRVAITGSETADECVYAVSDNGVGFDMRFSSKLFGVFERLHTAEEFQGSGVGLAMVARIVRRHGGRVWAEGRVDHGATFWFSLPKPGGSHP